MTRARIAGEITRKSEMAGMPDHSTALTCGEYFVLRRMATFGARRLTTRDFKGRDLCCQYKLGFAPARLIAQMQGYDLGGRMIATPNTTKTLQPCAPFTGGAYG